MNLREEEDRISFRERSKKARKRRNDNKKWTLIASNTAAALIIVIAVLAVKATMPGQHIEKSDDKGVSVASEAAVEVPTPTAASVPDVATQATGTDKWVRKDLDPSKPMIALTFDDGPYTKVTRKILKVLKNNNSRATFFIMGNRVEMYSETLQMAYDQGNQIGSHTYDHKDLRKMSAKGIEKEITKTNQEVKKVIGCETTALRPPYGSVNDRMRKTIKVPMIYWSVDSEDWKSRNANQVLKRCKSVQDGDILLFHDLYPSTASAIKKLVPRLVKQGYQLVTIDELFYYKKIDAKGGEVYYSGHPEGK